MNFALLHGYCDFSNCCLYCIVTNWFHKSTGCSEKRHKFSSISYNKLCPRHFHNHVFFFSLDHGIATTLRCRSYTQVMINLNYNTASLKIWAWLQLGHTYLGCFSWSSFVEKIFKNQHWFEGARHPQTTPTLAPSTFAHK